MDDNNEEQSAKRPRRVPPSPAEFDDDGDGLGDSVIAKCYEDLPRGICVSIARSDPCLSAILEAVAALRNGRQEEAVLCLFERYQHDDHSFTNEVFESCFKRLSEGRFAYVGGLPASAIEDLEELQQIMDSRDVDRDTALRAIRRLIAKTPDMRNGLLHVMLLRENQPRVQCEPPLFVRMERIFSEPQKDMLVFACACRMKKRVINKIVVDSTFCNLFRDDYYPEDTQRFLAGLKTECEPVHNVLSKAKSSRPVLWKRLMEKHAMSDSELRAALDDIYSTSLAVVEQPIALPRWVYDDDDGPRAGGIIRSRSSDTTRVVTLYCDADFRRLWSAFAAVHDAQTQRAELANAALQQQRRPPAIQVRDRISMRIARECTLTDPGDGGGAGAAGGTLRVPPMELIFEDGELRVTVDEAAPLELTLSSSGIVRVEVRRSAYTASLVDVGERVLRLLAALQAGHVAELTSRISAMTRACFFCGRELKNVRSINQGAGDTCQKLYATRMEHSLLMLRSGAEVQQLRTADIVEASRAAAGPRPAMWLQQRARPPQQSSESEVFETLLELLSEDEERAMEFAARLCGLPDSDTFKQGCQDLARVEASGGQWLPAVFGRAPLKRMAAALRVVEHFGGPQDALVGWMKRVLKDVRYDFDPVVRAACGA